MNFCHYFRSRQAEIVNFLKELVHLESPSTDKKSVDKCSEFIARELEKTGAETKRISQDQTGDLFILHYPSEASLANERLLILAHSDTVWPVGKIKSMPFYITENKVFGPGVLDMKAGVTMIVQSLKALHTLNIRPKKNITVFINSAEEIGSQASSKHIINLAKNSTAVLCLEPALPGGALKIQRKGRLVIHLKTKGKSAHAATPEKGVNAIEELLFHLLTVQKLKTKETTVNIGMISGGEKANVVAGEASATLDFRFWKNQQKDHILRHFKQLLPSLNGAKVSFSIESETPPMEKTEASSRLLKQVRNIASPMNITLPAGKASGGSDASTASQTGVATLDGLGPDGEGIHAENEHLLLTSLIERTALLTEILVKL